MVNTKICLNLEFYKKLVVGLVIGCYFLDSTGRVESFFNQLFCCIILVNPGSRMKRVMMLTLKKFNKRNELNADMLHLMSG